MKYNVLYKSSFGMNWARSFEAKSREEAYIKAMKDPEVVEVLAIYNG